MVKTRSRIFNQLKNVSKALMRYPASIICEIVFSIVCFIAIEANGWLETKLLLSLYLAFSFGMFINMALGAALQRFRNNNLDIWLGNAAGLAATILIWALLYFSFDSIPDIFVARIFAASAIAFIAFMLIASVNAGRFDTNHMVYMTIKSLFISLLYFVVLWLGLSLVAFSVQTLIYDKLSSNIYAHIAVFGQFVAFIFFLGNFPSFSKDESDEKIKGAIKQPKFIEILFQYILIPIILILSLVLFIWAVRIVVVGTVASFVEITVIFNAFALSGIILYFLVCHYNNFLAKLYRIVFPIAALIFLAFLAYKIYLEIADHGLTVQSYFVILLWAFSVFSAALFIFRPKAKTWLCLALACLLIAVSVMPAIGYEDLPINMQIARLERVLKKNDMLQSGEIVPNPNISDKDKATISDAVRYIFSYKNPTNKTPSFLEGKNVNEDFEKIFGFESSNGIPKTYYSIWVEMKTKVLPIGEFDFVALYTYEFSINIRDQKYLIRYDDSNMYHSIKVYKGKDLIAEKNLEDYFNGYVQKYKDTLNNGKVFKNVELDVDEMSVTVEADDLKVTVLFNQFNLEYDPLTGETKGVSVSIYGIFVDE